MTTKRTKTDMSDITAVRFDDIIYSEETYLSSELADGPPYTVHGIALGAGDVTKGKSGIKKKWPAEELEKAADTLQDTNLVVDHENGSHGVVGRVTKAGYKDGTGVVYEAELYDKDLAEKVDNGLLEVSIGGLHEKVENLEEDPETEALIVEDIRFKNLSVVPSGASPSNTLEIGGHAELSEAELSSFTEGIEREELQEIEPGMWVQWDGGDMHGVTISQIQDGEIEVDIYEERDGQWRSTEETTMVSTDDLSEWDVDEDDIGPAEDSDSDDEEEDDSGDEESSEEENAAIDRGEYVKWRDVDNGWRYGQIIEVEQEGAQMVATLRRFTESGDKLDETEQKPVQGLDKWDASPETQTDSETTETDSDEDDVSADTTADINDLINVLSQIAEQAAATSKDVPAEDAEPSHRPMGHMADLFNKFLDGEGTPESTLADFIDWLNESEELEACDRGEGEDYKLDSNEAIKRMREHDAAYIPDEVDEDLSASDEGNETESDEAELQDYEMHEVTWDGTTEQDWSTPDLEDFVDESWDDLSEDEKNNIASHFIISASGFPPETYGDLKLPVVEPSGELNVNALAAVKGGRGASAVDGLSSSMEEDIIGMVNGLANEHFDRDWGTDEEENMSTEEDAISEDEMATGEPTEPTKTVGGVRVLPGDDLRQEYNGESDADSLTQYKVTTMNEEIEEKLSELDDPVAVEAEELQTLQDKADRFEEMSESLEALRERTDILDEVSRDMVEELRDGDEPVVVESARYEELQSEAEQVKGVYAAQLSEHYDAFDAEELAEKFSIEELREKFEDQFGAVEEELADSSEAEPVSQDPSEEELEEESAEEESEEELADEVAEKQEEIRNKILN